MAASLSHSLEIVRRIPVGAPDGWLDDVHPVLRRVYAARGVLNPAAAATRLSGLLPPQSLPGLASAVSLLAEAIARRWRIVVAADFDCDGACGAALAVRGLRMLGATEVGFAVPHRMRHGYGLSPALVDTLQPAPDLIVTVDNGIASHAGVAAAKARGCKVIVTDHHLPGASLPDADAIVNPNLGWKRDFDEKCVHGRAPCDPCNLDACKNLCGAGVMFYLLLALRVELFGDDPGREGRPDLASLLDLVALATVADLVPLDRNNRILVEAGLRRIRAGRACPGLTALIDVAGRDPRKLDAADLGYALGPRINAAGRLEDMTLGIECLLTDDGSRARELATILHGINGERRDVQDAMVAEAETMLARIDANQCGVSLFDPAWHPGVVGLVASRIKERLHRPVVAFAPADRESRGMLRGSARSIPGLHIRDALAELDARHPGLIPVFGGHAMAAGLSLREEDFARFSEHFDAVVGERVAPESLRPVLHSDGELAPADFDLGLARQLRGAGPWGQGFPPPLFDNVFECAGWRRVGAQQRHLRLDLRDPRDGRMHAAIRFDAEDEPPEGATLRVAYELALDEWRGTERLGLRVRHLQAA